MLHALTQGVTPAKAGAHFADSAPLAAWVPAFAGKTMSIWGEVMVCFPGSPPMRYPEPLNNAPALPVPMCLRDDRLFLDDAEA